MEEKFALTNALKSLDKRKIQLDPNSPEAAIPKYRRERRAMLNKKKRSTRKSSIK
jgi:hypothetical protein